jgi:hypothetical protein
MVPFFARHFAGFATDANSRIGEEADFDLITHVRVPALIGTMCAFADHTNWLRKAGTHDDKAEDGRSVRAKIMPIFSCFVGFLIHDSYSFPSCP